MPRSKEFDEEEVLRKAMLLFWQKGYYDTSIKDLIKFLGISNASIYHTFGGKQQLFDRAFELYKKINYEGLKAFLEEQDDTKAAMRLVFQKIVQDDHVDEDCKGCFIANSTLELLPKNQKIEASIVGYKNEMVQVFLSFLEKGVKSGQISAD
ncbi:MAG: TetR/AcrR family transcriptional regulator, partial [Bacteroidota bacterium]